MTSIFDDPEKLRTSQLKTSIFKNAEDVSCLLLPAELARPPGTAWAKSPRTPSPSKKKVLRYLKILILLFGGFILVFLSLFGVSSLAPFFEAHVLLILEPLGVDFELPS